METYVLDANAIREDFRFTRNPGRLLLREAREERIRLVVPQIAFDEAVNLYREAIEEEKRAVRQARSRLERLGVSSGQGEELDVDATVAAYSSELATLLSSAHANIHPYPSVSHEMVARRAMRRDRPFDPKGKDGYRDTLLWETVLELCAEHAPIVLVSADNAAFSAKGTVDLLPELVQEVTEKGCPPASVRRIRHIEDFTSTLPTVPWAKLAVEHLLSANEEVRESVAEVLAEDAADFSQTETSVPGLPLEVDQLYIDAVHSVTDFTVVAAQTLEGEDVAVDLNAYMEVSLEVFVRKGDAYGYQGDELRIVDYDYNESFASGVEDRTLLVEFEAVYRPQEPRLEDIRVYNYLPEVAISTTGGAFT